MTEGNKKSFVLYFDMYPAIKKLSMEQKGELLEAMFEYAMAEAAQPGSLEAVFSAHPNMTADTVMAFLFVGETIRRDTEKWHQKHLRYQQAARERLEKRDGNSGLDKYTGEYRRQRSRYENDRKDVWGAF